MKSSKPARSPASSGAPRKSQPTESWAEAFRQALCTREVELVPEGFFMIHGWADMLGKSHSHTRRLLRDGVKAGKVETKDFRVRVGRSIRKEVHYRLTDKT